MKALYERLAEVLVRIEPRNKRARTWLDKLILHCRKSAKANLDQFDRRASIEAIRFDLQPLLIIQGRDEGQKPLYRQVDALLREMEQALETAAVAATLK